MQKKAVVLLSGGLDSTLALKLMIDDGVEVFPLNFSSVFFHRAGLSSKKFDVNIKVVECGDEYLEIVRNPPHGYGKNMNPCIDCRIFMLRKAKKYMEEIGASFLVTGEVLGQRPMSQRREAISLIEKEANVEGLVLRPLSAKFFPETEMEKSGLVDSKKLLAISGRSRKEQIKLAEEKNIKDYPCPAGGCLLTDPEFSKRLRESFEHGEISLRDIMLLKIGRHFRLENGVKIIVGRNREDNEQLENMHQDGEYLLQVETIPGPIVLLKSDCDEQTLKTAAQICVHYSDYDKKDPAAVLVKRKDGKLDIIKAGKIRIREIFKQTFFALAVPIIFCSGCEMPRDSSNAINSSNAISSIIMITESDNGKGFTINKEDVIQLELMENGSTGYSWRLTDGYKSHFELISEETISPICSTWVGCEVKFIRKFKVLASGESTIELNYLRVWEKVPPIKTFEIKIKVL